MLLFDARFIVFDLCLLLCARVSVCKRLFLDGDGMMFERSTREAKRSAKRDETTFRDEHPFKKNKR